MPIGPWSAFRPRSTCRLTPRVRQIIDTADFRRLARIGQLGLVSLVYPAALHTRFEHSLGVYRLALVYLKQLAHQERFAAAVSPGGGRGLRGRRPAARPGPLALLPPDRGHRPARRSQPRALRQQFPPRRRGGRRAAARLGHQPPRRGRPAERKAPRRRHANPGQHALRADRHRQGRLSLPRQPARGRPLRPPLRSAAAAGQPLPESAPATAWPSPTRARRPPS